METEWVFATNMANVATIVTGLAVVFPVFPYFKARRQRRQDADNWCVEPYWQLQDRKTPVRNNDGTVRVDVPFEVMFAELRLCEDELDARADGRVTNNSWRLWSESILSLRDNEQSIALLDATPGELTQLREFLKTAKDPITNCRFKQFWRGL